MHAQGCFERIVELVFRDDPVERIGPGFSFGDLLVGGCFLRAEVVDFIDDQDDFFQIAFVDLLIRPLV